VSTEGDDRVAANARGLTFNTTLRCVLRNMPGLLIGDVAERVGVAAPTIRYYESIGLLKAPARSATGYRRYSERTVEELRFIKKAQALAFSLDEIGEILKLTRSGNTPCSRVVSLGHQHLAAVDERIRQLQAFRDQLASELAKWGGKQSAGSGESASRTSLGAGLRRIRVVSFDASRGSRDSPWVHTRWLI